MIKPEDYYPLLVFQAWLNEAATKRLKNVLKIDFSSLEHMLKES